MATFMDPHSGGFGRADNPDLSHAWKKARFEDYKARRGEFSHLASSSPSSTQDFTKLARETIRLQQEAAKPAVESLRAGIPTTEAAFEERGRQLEGEKEPLKQRYQSILDDITRREGVETRATERATTREFAGRGLLPTGGGFEQFLGEKISPISQFFAGQAKDVGLEQAGAERQLSNLLANLPIEKQKALDAVNQAIAQLQAGAGASGIQTGLGLFQAQQAAQQAAAQRALAERTFELEQQIAQQAEARAQRLDPLEMALLQAQTQRQLQLSRSGGGADDFTSVLEDLASQFGG